MVFLHLLQALLPAEVHLQVAQVLLHQVQELLQSFAKMVFQLVHLDKLMFAQVVHSHVVEDLHLVKQVVELG